MYGAVLESDTIRRRSRFLAGDAVGITAAHVRLSVDEPYTCEVHHISGEGGGGRGGGGVTPCRSLFRDFFCIRHSTGFSPCQLVAVVPRLLQRSEK